jgi:hypothetical protein
MPAPAREQVCDRLDVARRVAEAAPEISAWSPFKTSSLAGRAGRCWNIPKQH